MLPLRTVGRLAVPALLLLSIACGEPSAAQTAPSPPSGVEERIETMREAYGGGGLAVAVVSGQETVLARGFGIQADGTPYTATTPSGAYSATKALSSFVYASLVEDGLIDLDAPLGQFLDGAPAAWADIPFWRLLNHTSGITMIVNRPEFEQIDGDPTAGNDAVY